MNEMQTMLMELFLSGLINKLKDGHVDEAIEDLERGLKGLKEGAANENKAK